MNAFTFTSIMQHARSRLEGWGVPKNGPMGPCPRTGHRRSPANLASSGLSNGRARSPSGPAAVLSLNPGGSRSAPYGGAGAPPTGAHLSPAAPGPEPPRS
ncbi:hypothetical protein GCM10023083_46580 [Streptomyces phyllanthi]